MPIKVDPMPRANWVIGTAALLVAVSIIAWSVGMHTKLADMAVLPANHAEITRSGFEARMTGLIGKCVDRLPTGLTLRVRDPRCSEAVQYINDELAKNENSLNRDGAGL